MAKQTISSWTNSKIILIVPCRSHVTIFRNRDHRPRDPQMCGIFFSILKRIEDYNYSGSPGLFMDPADFKLRMIHKLTRFHSSLWQLNTWRQCDSDECKRSLPIGIDRDRSTNQSSFSLSFSLPPCCPFYVLSLKTIPYAIDLVKRSRSRVFSSMHGQCNDPKRKRHVTTIKMHRYYSFN